MTENVLYPARVDENGRRTTEACPTYLSPSARWLLFVVKGFSNIG